MPTDLDKQKTDRAHHPYSPSSLQSLEACPCFKSREGVQHVRTVIGTISHNVTETGMDDNRLDDDDASAAAECLDFYEQRLRLAKGALVQELLTPSQKQIFEIIELKETYLPIDNVTWTETVIDLSTLEKTTHTVKGTTAGYIDAAIIMHDRTYAEIFDWKFGMWAVEKAENNLQGLSYALGMFKAYPSLEQVRFWFKQPNLDGAMALTTHIIGRADIAKLYLRIQVVVERAKKARASGTFDMAVPMVPNCNFCGNIGACTKVAAFACNVGHKFHPLAIPADITPSKVYDPQQSKLGLMLSGVMATWSKAYRTQQTDRVIRGSQPLPDGYRITQKADREIVDPGKYKELALKRITTEEYETTLTPGFGAVEKLISAKAERGNKKATIEEFKKELIDSGAVVVGQPYSFLQVVSSKEESSENTPKT